MPHRLSALRDPVELVHDGESLLAQRGESLAVALLAADRLPLARSPKLHRPRGPYCLRGGCDGCLARVDGVPNVMTCLRAVRGGEQIETQNVLGTRETDLMRAADFLFPRGLDHHRLFAGVRGVSNVVQSFARRVAGLGLLPERVQEALDARRLEIEVLIVGGGAAGLGAAAELGSRNSLLVDEGLALGGSLGLLDPARAREAIDTARDVGVTCLTATSAIGMYRDPESGALHALLVGPKGALLASARFILVASGGHDPVRAFEGNDLPGVVSARAALKLWRAGVAPAKRVVCAGSGRFERALAAAGAAHFELISIDADALVRATGRTRLSSVIARDRRRERRISAGALAIEGALCPSTELAVQAGAAVEFDPARGYVPKRDRSGRVADRVYCAGSCAGADDALADGARVARAIASAR